MMVAGEIRRYRRYRKLTAQQLADRCAALGLPLNRSVIASLESGRRPVVTLAELLVLAAALEVTPLALAIPLGRRETMEILPGVELSTWHAAEWWQGQDQAVIDADGRLIIGPLESKDDERLKRAEQLSREGHLDVGWLGYSSQVIHGQVLHLAEDVLLDPSRPEKDLEIAWGALAAIRRDIRARGLIPPPLRPELARLEERDAARESLE
jgi:transcriptional regulator with XRE-family HTH domain